MEIKLIFNDKVAQFLNEKKEQIIDVNFFNFNQDIVQEFHNKTDFLYDNCFNLIPATRTFTYDNKYASLFIALSLQQNIVNFENGKLEYDEYNIRYLTLFKLEAEIYDKNFSLDIYKNSEIFLINALNPYINKLIRKIRDDLRLDF